MLIEVWKGGRADRIARKLEAVDACQRGGGIGACDNGVDLK